MKKEDIISAIETKVGSSIYTNWRIGLTNDPDERRTYWSDTEKQNVTYWTQWPADSLSDAQDIEAEFIRQGMKGGTGGDILSNRIVYIYIF